MIAVYVGLMLISYLGYNLLDYYRLNIFGQRVSGQELTEQDVQTFHQLNLWTNSFELSFIIIFILAALVVYYFRKNKRIVTYFIISHLAAFAAIYLLGYTFSFFFDWPFGNFIQPLFFPSYLVIITMFYAIFVMIRERFIKRHA